MRCRVFGCKDTAISCHNQAVRKECLIFLAKDGYGFELVGSGVIRDLWQKCGVEVKLQDKCSTIPINRSEMQYSKRSECPKSNSINNSLWVTSGTSHPYIHRFVFVHENGLELVIVEIYTTLHHTPLHHTTSHHTTSHHTTPHHTTPYHTTPHHTTPHHTPCPCSETENESTPCGLLVIVQSTK